MMARNLREKIKSLVNDAYDLRSESIVTKIENLVKEELNLRDEERTYEYEDLVKIQADASRQYVDIAVSQEAVGNITGDQASLRAMCLVDATVGFLRSKGLLSSILKYKKKK